LSEAVQFSCWSKHDLNFSFLSGAKPIPFHEFAQAQIAADKVMAGKVPDPTGGATHYYATTMPKPPAWMKGAKETLRLGHHVFYKDVPCQYFRLITLEPAFRADHL
jgi:hypothetical protein